MHILLNNKFFLLYSLEQKEIYFEVKYLHFVLFRENSPTTEIKNLLHPAHVSTKKEKQKSWLGDSAELYPRLQLSHSRDNLIGAQGGRESSLNRRNPD